MGKLKFEIDEPKDGWTKVQITYEKEKIIFHPSNIPNDPIDNLVDSILSLLSYSQSEEIKWNLEPKSKLLKIEKKGNQYELTLSHQNDFFKKDVNEINLNLSGDFKEIILPIFRGISNFNSKTFNQKDWANTEKKKLAKLKMTIQKIKEKEN